MQLPIHYGGKALVADLDRPIDISMPLVEGLSSVKCFYAPPVEFHPVVAGEFIGSTAQGGPVNFLNVRLNPHGNGTHTECIGHIAKEPFTINQSLKKFHFLAKLVSIYPTKIVNGDRVLLADQLEPFFTGPQVDALVIRTLPNDSLKLHTNYSGANPPYLDPELVNLIVKHHIQHLLIDLPSIDREEDGGKLAAHKAFWQYPENPRTDCTITELVHVPNEVQDGLYLLNLQIASFEIDVSPSKPILYELNQLQ